MDEHLRKLGREALRDPAARKRLERLWTRAGVTPAMQKRLTVGALLEQANELYTNVRLSMSLKKTPIHDGGEYHIFVRINGRINPDYTAFATDLDDAIGTLGATVDWLFKEKNQQPGPVWVPPTETRGNPENYCQCPR